MNHSSLIGFDVGCWRITSIRELIEMPQSKGNWTTCEIGKTAAR